jgi:hypothetical protein
MAICVHVLMRSHVEASKTNDFNAVSPMHMGRTETVVLNACHADHPNFVCSEAKT